MARPPKGSLHSGAYVNHMTGRRRNRRVPWLPQEDVETLRVLADEWAEGARLSEKHGQMFHSTPSAMYARVESLRAIIARCEGKP